MSARVLSSSLPKCAVACEFCRAKKIKCDGQEPCRNCMNHDRQGTCYYPPANPRPRRNARERNKVLQDRLDRAEALLQAAGFTPDIEVPVCNDTAFDRRVSPTGIPRGEAFISPYPPLPGHRNAGVDRDVHGHYQSLPLPTDPMMHNPQQPAYLALPYDSSPLNSPENPGQHVTAQINLRGDSVEVGTASILTSHGRQESVSDFDPSVQAIEYSREVSVIQSSMSQHAKSSDVGNRQLQSPAATVPEREESPTQAEIHGPGSYLSICSNAGVKWVSERTGLSNFSSSATVLASFVARSLKLQTRSSRFERIQEPDAETARRFCQVFFDECFEATLNIVHRPAFEDRLNTHLQVPEEADADPAWYALRNIIYAFGSRISINQENSWFEAQTHSWQYFQNSFSVHSDLVYSWSSIATVQALFAMALFVEGLGAPKLEYMLVSNALRLAHSKGLQMQPSRIGDISEAEKERRSWLFWSIYIYEKHISFRSRRPSIIDDDDIDCAIPKSSPDGKPNRAEVFQHMIRHAQISSAVMKELFSVKGRQKTPDLIAKTVQDLEERLQQWRQNLPTYLNLDLPIRNINLPSGILVEHKMWIFLNFYATLSAIHSVFSCPWISPDVNYEQDSMVGTQRDRSIIAAAEAARSTILATRSIAADAAAPAWLTFLFPFIGMLNLFTYIIHFPNLSSVASDIDLLDMAVGYFGYVAFSTQSHVSVTFVKELAQWARAATISTPTKEQPHRIQNPASSIVVSGLACSNPQPPSDFDDMARCDFGFDDWPTFFSVM